MEVEDICWNYIFQYLLNKYWKDLFRSVPVFLKDMDGDLLAKFECTPEGFNCILLSKNQGLTSIELAGVLLHEMCHHIAFEKHGINIEPHGHQWQSEMKHVGFIGEINAYTDGITRVSKEEFELFIKYHNSKI